MGGEGLPTPPVLVIAYRRPDLVSEVMRAVAEAAPARLFLACDGPNPDRPEDVALVDETRRVMEAAIEWPCEVQRLYSATNQGCRTGVVRAIDWFFANVDAGIILEDDCVPHPDFFAFCADLLRRYAGHAEIMHISGDGGLAVPRERRPESYVLTNEVLVWGWASWRRAWSLYDRDLERWATVREKPREVDDLFGSRIASRYWTPILDRLLDHGEPDTWDYQWSFTVRERRGVAIVPTRNLITNVGYREDATHTTQPGGARSDVPLEPLGELVHPQVVSLDESVDWAIQCEMRGFSDVEISSRWRRVMRRVRQFLVGLTGSNEQS